MIGVTEQRCFALPLRFGELVRAGGLQLNTIVAKWRINALGQTVQIIVLEIGEKTAFAGGAKRVDIAIANLPPVFK